MALDQLDDPSAVRAAVDEFDRIGRSAFLEKYGFSEARAYFLQIEERLYDSKAIIGAAHGFQFASLGPLGANDFSGGAATVQRKLESMGFTVMNLDAEQRVDQGESRTRVSDLLVSGNVYTRKELESILPTRDATLNTGVFTPAGFASVLLFVTEKKTPDRTQYVDKLNNDLLHWQGQSTGRTDARIIEHQTRGFELLLFYRVRKTEHPHAGFRYEGLFRYVSHIGARPADFILQRVGEPLAQVQFDAEVEAEASGAFDPTSIGDARKKTFAAIVMRQGQPGFRRDLLQAYEGRCAITGCDVVDVLEAAHICRYMGRETNVVSNGLLLRSDLHTLYDRVLIAIDPATLRLRISPELKDSEYGALAGRLLRVPKKPELRPSLIALLSHKTLVQWVWEE